MSWKCSFSSWTWLHSTRNLPQCTGDPGNSWFAALFTHPGVMSAPGTAAKLTSRCNCCSARFKAGKVGRGVWAGISSCLHAVVLPEAKFSPLFSFPLFWGVASTPKDSCVHALGKLVVSLGVWRLSEPSGHQNTSALLWRAHEKLRDHSYIHVGLFHK